MHKLITATAVCAVAVGLTIAPAATGKAPPKQVSGSVTLSASPTTVEPTTTGVTVTGNVKSTSGCRKDRTVRFQYVSGTGVVTPSAVVAETGPNGDFTATLAQPPTNADGTTVVQATVDQIIRKVGSKKKGQKTKKGRRFDCLAIGPTSSNTLTVSDGLP
jgi:hypothetical protein